MKSLAATSQTDSCKVFPCCISLKGDALKYTLYKRGISVLMSHADLVMVLRQPCSAVAKLRSDSGVSQKRLATSYHVDEYHQSISLENTIVRYATFELALGKQQPHAIP